VALGAGWGLPRVASGPDDVVLRLIREQQSTLTQEVLRDEVCLPRVRLRFGATERDLRYLVLAEKGPAGGETLAHVRHVRAAQVVEGEDVHGTIPAGASGHRAHVSGSGSQHGGVWEARARRSTAQHARSGRAACV